MNGFSAARLGAVGLALLTMAACDNSELVLDGPRFDVRSDVPVLGADLPDGGAPTSDAPEFDAPAQSNNTDWTHRGGGPTHQVTHPALGTSLTQIWQAGIGQGNTKRGRITADPIVGGGRIFTMDSASQVVATGNDGATLWSRALVPVTDKATDASGGGLAYGSNTVIAATGFGEIFALDATSGAIKWRQKLDAPVTSAPTLVDNLVYVVTRDSRGWAVDLENGRLRWQVPGAPTGAFVVGGAGPAVSDRLAIFPFGSGEIVATLKNSGVRAWSSSVSGQRRGRAYAGVGDITGDPVLVGDTIYAANHAGRTVAMEVTTGSRKWTATEGALGPVWPAGDSVFLINDQAQLMRLNAETGETIWAQDLPYFTRVKPKRRNAIYAHRGPILAGGRLIVASDDGLLRSFDPSNGALLNSVALPGGAASTPVVANGVLYVVTGKGNLVAFR